MTVVDASIIGARLIDHPGSLAARDLLASADSLIAPELVWVEVTNALWKTVRWAGLSPEEGRERVSRMRTFPIDTVPTLSLLDDAWEQSVRLGATVYDCLYLALAMRERTQVATLDKRLAECAERGGLCGLVKCLA